MTRKRTEMEQAFLDRFRYRREELRKTVRGKLLRAGLGESLLEDAWQTLNMEVLKASKREISNPDGYISTIVKNSIIDFINKEKDAERMRQTIRPREESMTAVEMGEFLSRNGETNIPWGDREALRYRVNRLLMVAADEKSKVKPLARELRHSPRENSGEPSGGTGGMGYVYERFDSGWATPEQEISAQQLASELQSSILPECLGSFGSEAVRDRVQKIYVGIILEEKDQKAMAGELGVGENIVSAQLGQLRGCIKKKLLERGFLGAPEKIPESYERAVSRLARVVNESELADSMNRSQFLDALPYAVYCRVNNLDLGNVTQRYYQWKSRKRLQAWLHLLDDIQAWADRQYELERDRLIAYMEYLFEHKSGSIEPFASEQWGGLL